MLDRTKDIVLPPYFNTMKTVELDQEARGTGKNYTTLKLSEGCDKLSIPQLNVIALTLLNKRMEEVGVTLETGVFMPCDNMEYANTYGLPMYVFETEEGVCHTYEFEVHVGKINQDTMFCYRGEINEHRK